MESIPKIFLASPRYSQEIIARSHESREWGEHNDVFGEEDHVQIVHKVASLGSLLPWCFNSLLAAALNHRDKGEVTHFAMQHSDIEPTETGWCNELYRRMRVRGDVAISAVASLKEHERTRTTTAIGVRGQPFNVLRYINTSDRPGMPETFSTRDVAQAGNEVLLINTGLMLLDLTLPAWDDFHFEFRDDIRKNPETNQRQAWASSEDWNLSRWMDKHGLPYSATWLRLKHYGMDYWDSFEFPPVYPTFYPAQEAECQKALTATE